MGITSDPLQPLRCSPLPRCSVHFKEQNIERDERWKEKHLKKAPTQKSDVTYGSHHRPGLPSVPAVVACWHPLVTAQNGNNPGQRIQGSVIQEVRIPWGKDFSTGGGEGWTLSGGCYCEVQKLAGICRKQVLNSSVGFSWVLRGFSFSRFYPTQYMAKIAMLPLPGFTSAYNKL